MMNDIKGCSLCAVGEERYERYSTRLGRKRVTRYQYDYSTVDERNTFTISYGNRLTAGGSLSGEACFSIAKAYIDKAERRYVADKELTFAAVEKDTSRYALDLQIIEC